MIGLKKPDINLKFFLVLGLALAITWFGFILFISNRYLTTMLQPPCSITSSPPKGFEEVQIPFSGQSLTGWWAPAKNGAIILLFGGHGADQASLREEAKFLSDAGYGILTTNYRHCLGEKVSFGWLEREEFEAVYTYTQELDPRAEIGVFGFSAGAITAIRGTEAHPEIRALTAVGNYASLKQEIITKDEPIFSLRWQIERGVYLLYGLRTGVSPAQVNILPILEKLNPRPVLLIHGEYEADHNQANLQLRAAGKNAVLWIAPHSDHGAYLSEVPDIYKETVINFFEQNLP